MSALLLAALHAQAAYAAGTCTSNPVYIWPYVEHASGEGGQYSHGPDFDAIRMEATSAGVPVTFYFDGIQTRQLLDEPQICGQDPGFASARATDGSMTWPLRHGADAIAAFLADRNDEACICVDGPCACVNFGYHGEDTHGPFEIPASATDRTLSLTQGLDWQVDTAQAVDFAYLDRDYDRCGGVGGLFDDPWSATPTINPFAWWSTYQRSSRGSVQRVADVFGHMSAATTHGLESPATELVLRSIQDIFVAARGPAVTASILPQGASERDAMRLGGSDTDAFWYMGRLNTKARSDSELPASARSAADIAAFFAAMDRGHARIVSVPLSLDDLWQPIFPDDPVDISSIREKLQALVDTTAQDPCYQFATPEQLNNVAGGDMSGAHLTRYTMRQAAAAVRDSWVSTRRIPDGYPLSFDWAQMNLSVTQAWEGMARALSDASTSGQLQGTTALDLHVLGPRCTKEELESTLTASSLRIADVANAARAWAATSPGFVPCTVEVGGQTLNSGEMLLAMTRAWTRLDQGASPTATVVLEQVIPDAHEPPYGMTLDRIFSHGTPDPYFWFAKMQLWTVVPARM